MKLEYEVIKQKFEALTMGKAHSPGKNVDNKEEVKAKGESKSLYFQPSDFKRELKIIGQIREPGQKDKLSFVSLVRQIEGALQKGYKPQEVVGVDYPRVSRNPTRWSRGTKTLGTRLGLRETP